MFMSSKIFPLTSVCGLYPLYSMSPVNAGLNETRSPNENSEESGIFPYYCVRML